MVLSAKHHSGMTKSRMLSQTVPANTRKLVEIAEKNDPRPLDSDGKHLLHAFQNTIEVLEASHGNLIDDDERFPRQYFPQRASTLASQDVSTSTPRINGKTKERVARGTKYIVSCGPSICAGNCLCRVLPE
jgi:hypothetical protein